MGANGEEHLFSAKGPANRSLEPQQAGWAGTLNEGTWAGGGAGEQKGPGHA